MVSYLIPNQGIQSPHTASLPNVKPIHPVDARAWPELKILSTIAFKSREFQHNRDNIFSCVNKACLDATISFVEKLGWANKPVSRYMNWIWNLINIWPDSNLAIRYVESLENRTLWNCPTIELFYFLWALDRELAAYAEGSCIWVGKWSNQANTWKLPTKTPLIHWWMLCSSFYQSIQQTHYRLTNQIQRVQLPGTRHWYQRWGYDNTCKLPVCKYTWKSDFERKDHIVTHLTGIWANSKNYPSSHTG